MTTLIVTTSIALYLTGWTVGTAIGGRILAGRSECHREGRRGDTYQWRNMADCRRYCAPGCWRPSERVEGRHVALAAAPALVFFVAWLPLLALHLANRGPKPMLSNERRIRELERELGIGGDA